MMSWMDVKKEKKRLRDHAKLNGQGDLKGFQRTHPAGTRMHEVSARLTLRCQRLSHVSVRPPFLPPASSSALTSRVTSRRTSEGEIPVAGQTSSVAGKADFLDGPEIKPEGDREPLRDDQRRGKEIEPQDEQTAHNTRKSFQPTLITPES